MQVEAVNENRSTRLVPTKRALVKWPLLVALGATVLFATCLAMPWFASAENPPMNPFSHWLIRGWRPGETGWAWILLGLCVVLATGIAMSLLYPRTVILVLALGVGMLLLVATILEWSAHPSLDPGPDLHSDWGTWIGALAVIAACSCLVAAIRALDADR